MSNYFMQHYFAQKYFDPDEYFRLGVKVPVPVVPVPGGSAAPMGYYRMMNCEWLDRESCELKDEVNKAWKKLKKKVHRDPLARKTKTKEQIERLRDKELVDLRKKIQELTSKYHEMRRAGLRDEPYVQRLKRRAEELERCYQRVEQRLLELQKEIDRLIEENKRQKEEIRRQRKRIRKLERARARSLELHLKQHKKMQELEKSQAAATKEIADLKEVIATKMVPEPVGETIGQSLLAALPYAVGSAACFAGTYYLVPDDWEVLKFAGYAGGTALAGAAILRAAPVLSNMISGMLIPEMPN